MAPEAVYNMHNRAYHCFVFQVFKVNLKNLREAIKKKLEEVKDDETTLFNSLQQKTVIAVMQPYPEWNQSTAQTLLVQDIESGAADISEPALLRQTRPEYMVYPLRVFRDHIYKEKTKKLSRAYWDHQRQLKDEARRQKNK